MSDTNKAAPAAWELRLRDSLALFGHRNWIVVADAAYPAQANPGIETVVAGGDQIDVVRAVLQAIEAGGHIRPNVFTDLEISFVAEGDAPGISAYRRQLDTLFAPSSRKQLPHEEIISRLDHSARLFRILIVKTAMNLPYTSVFFELDCGYWNADAETRLRKAVKESQAQIPDSSRAD